MEGIIPLAEQIKQQGDKVRLLKSQKAPKEQVWKFIYFGCILNVYLYLKTFDKEPIWRTCYIILYLLFAAINM